MSVKKMTTMALLIAISVVSVLVIHIPFPPAPFLEYDPADIPILIGTCIFGPLTGVVLTVIASLIQGFTVSLGSGLYGILMHVISTSALVTTVGFVYRRKKTFAGLVLALVSGVVAMTVVMICANLIVTPLFMETTTKAVAEMLIPVIIPFNLMKAGINAAITLPVYSAIDCIFVQKGFFHDTKKLSKKSKKSEKRC